MKFSRDMLVSLSWRGHIRLSARVADFKKWETWGHSQNRWGMVSISALQKVQELSPPLWNLTSLFVFRVPLLILCCICL